MDNETKMLGKLIKASLKKTQSADLVLAMGHFDAVNHAIPTAREFNIALASLSVPAARAKGSFILLTAAPGTSPVPVTEDEIVAMHNQYVEMLQKQRSTQA